jgi:hypothetical protein
MDCEAVKTSRQPYELQMRQADGRTFPVQVFRGDNLTRTQYTKVGGHVLISKLQGNFQLEYEDLAGTSVRFSYSVPTDKFIWQQDTRIVTYNTIIAGAPTAGQGFTQAYEMLPDDTISVGACTFPVKHFRFKQSTAEKTSDEEIWFSPDLRTNLRLIEVTTLADGKTSSRKLEATDITTDFSPLR